MKKNLHTLVALFIIIILPCSGIAQAPDVRSFSNYVLFTGNGDFYSTNPTVINGDLGIHMGAFNGTPIVNGTVFQAPATLQASIDICAAYNELGAITCDSTISGSLAGQTLTPGVYCTSATATNSGTLTLDAQGDPNAEFIIKINGSLSTSTQSNIVLINGASQCNVFFWVNGEVNLGSNSTFTGNLFNTGNLTLSANSRLNGRALSCAGNINISNSSLTVDPTCITILPVTLMSFNATKQAGRTLLTWSTANEVSSRSFVIERSNTATAANWTAIGTVAAAGNSNTTKHYSLMDNNVKSGANFYRINSISLDGSSSFSSVKMVQFDGTTQPISIFPNPVKGMFTLTGADKGSKIMLMDMSGKQLSQHIANGSGTDRITTNNMATGTYLLKVLYADGNSAILKLNKQ